MYDGELMVHVEVEQIKQYVLLLLQQQQQYQQSSFLDKTEKRSSIATTNNKIQLQHPNWHVFLPQQLQ